MNTQEKMEAIDKLKRECDMATAGSESMVEIACIEARYYRQIQVIMDTL